MAAAWNLCYSDTLPYYIRHEAAKIWISWTYRFSIVLVYVFHKAPLWSRVLQFDVTSISCCFPSTNAIKPDLWDLSVSNYPSWENCLKHQNYFYVEIELLSRSCLEKQTRGWLEQVSDLFWVMLAVEESIHLWISTVVYKHSWWLHLLILSTFNWRPPGSVNCL